MADFKTQIKGLMSNSGTFTSSTTPTHDEITQFLTDGAKDLINKIIAIKPDEAFKFAEETEAADDNGITVVGKILSVLREHDSTSILRMCTQIPPQLKYESTDVDSLFYRSKYNPGYFVSNGKVFVRPAAAGSDNDMKVSHLKYPTITHSNDSGDNLLPDEYEYLVVLYAAAMTCLAKAGNQQYNLPTIPRNVHNPYGPDFDTAQGKGVEIPNSPVFISPRFNLSFGGISSAIAKQDMELIDKELTLFEKKLDVYKEKFNTSEKEYNAEVKAFDSNVDNLTKNADRKLQAQASEYRSEIYYFQYLISEYSQRLTEAMAKYKWYMEQYIRFMNQYSSGIMSIAQQQKPSKDEVRAKAPKEEQQTQQEGVEYGG